MKSKPTFLIAALALLLAGSATLHAADAHWITGTGSWATGSWSSTYPSYTTRPAPIAGDWVFIHSGLVTISAGDSAISYSGYIGVMPGLSGSVAVNGGTWNTAVLEVAILFASFVLAQHFVVAN